MAKPAADEWKVFTHSPLAQLAENLWRAEGSLPGMSMGRTMTVAKTTSGDLVIHNAIALGEEEQKKLESLGTPRWLVVPNKYHRLDAPRYKKRYPGLRVLAPAGSKKKIEEVIAVDATYEEFPADEAVRFEMVPGINNLEGAMFVRSRDGVTIVLNDVVFNMDKKADFLGWLFTTALGSAPGPRVSFLMKMFVVKDRPAFHAALERYAATPDLVRLVVSHEKVAHGPEAAAALRAAATFVR